MNDTQITLSNNIIKSPTIAFETYGMNLDLSLHPWIHNISQALNYLEVNKAPTSPIGAIILRLDNELLIWGDNLAHHLVLRPLGHTKEIIREYSELTSPYETLKLTLLISLSFSFIALIMLVCFRIKVEKKCMIGQVDCIFDLKFSESSIFPDDELTKTNVFKFDNERHIDVHLRRMDMTLD